MQKEQAKQRIETLRAEIDRHRHAYRVLDMPTLEEVYAKDYSLNPDHYVQII